MDKTWMRMPRDTIEYSEGVRKFLDIASEKATDDGKIVCPCKDCRNNLWETLDVVKEHLMSRGLTGFTESFDQGESTSSGRVRGFGLGPYPSQVFCSCNTRGAKYSTELQVLKRKLEETERQMVERDEEMQKRMRILDEKLDKWVRDLDEKWEKRIGKLEEEMRVLKRLRQSTNPSVASNLSKANATVTNLEASSSQDDSTLIDVNKDMKQV